MFYSAHWKNNPNNELENYKIGVAVADNPLGPFEKSAANPILQKNTESGGIVSGTGHNSVLKDREGKLWCVYHGRTNKTGDDRMVFLDELMLTQNGELKVNGPTVKAD